MYIENNRRTLFEQKVLYQQRQVVDNAVYYGSSEIPEEAERLSEELINKINEEIYCVQSEQMLKTVKKDPSLINKYHRQQIDKSVKSICNLNLNSKESVRPISLNQRILKLVEEVVPILEAESDIWASDNWKNTLGSVFSQLQNYDS